LSDYFLGEIMINYFKKLFNALNSVKNINSGYVIRRSTGTNSLTMLDSGANKATVTAMLRQITGIDLESAKSIVENHPYKFMTNISADEADLTKQALEFAGAKIEIK